MITTEEILDMMAHEWGLEDPSTIEGHMMAERGASAEVLLQFKELVDAVIENDYFGFIS